MVLFLNYKTYSVATDQSGKKFKAQGGERVMYTTHHPAWDAKNRYGLPDELPLDYSHIAHIFNEQAIDSVQETWSSQPQQEVQQQAPVEQEIQQPIQETSFEQVPLSEERISDDTVELDPNIPKSLRDLMIQYNVTETDIQIVVNQRGYYPQD